MNVQNGERPRWAWDGQHVQVVTGWELIVPGEQATGHAGAGPAVVAAPGRPAPVVEVERPAWSWGAAAT